MRDRTHLVGMKTQVHTIVGMSRTYEVEVVRGLSVRVQTVRQTSALVTEPVDRTFRIGDVAEYDSYNLRYCGTIVSIGDKTVTIRDDHGRSHRLKFEEFAWRNYDFDAAKIAASNTRVLETC